MDVVTLKNGAQVNVLPNGQYRFIKGASKQYLDRIRPVGPRGPNTKPSSKPVGMTYLLAKLKHDKGYNGRAVRSDIHRAKKTRPLDPSNPRDARLIRREGSLNRHDVAGTFTHRHKDGSTTYEQLNFDNGIPLGEKHPYGRSALRMTQPPKHALRTYAVAPRSARQLAASRQNIRAALAARGRRAPQMWNGNLIDL